MTVIKFIFKLPFVFVGIVLVGCTDQLIDQVESEKSMGYRFSSALKDEYLMLARKESQIYNDEIDARHFAIKAAQAGSGDEVTPEYPADWTLPHGKISEMNGYRERLFFALHKGGRQVSPRLAAQAQVAFDCWVEEEEEGYQSGEIQKCRSLFMEKLRYLEAAVHEMSPIFIVWFEMNSAKISQRGQKEIDQIVRAARQMPHHKISVRGLTDGIGGRKVNLQLSHGRARAVQRAITSNGIPTNRISTSVGMGEASGTRELEPNNRRVEVQLH